MKSGHLFTLIQLVLLACLLTGCSGGVPPATTTPVPTATSSWPGLSTLQVTTLQSLQKLDDHPFYVMHFAGDYEYPDRGAAILDERDFGCSLFAAMGEGSDRLYGRNFDWSTSPALLLFTDPPDGYASVSMVDLEYLGIQPQDANDLAGLPLSERTDLLSAPSMPFDGMNEHGLAVGMASVPGDYQFHAAFDPGKPTIGSIGILRQILDHARNVKEAVAIFKGYNLDFRGGPLIHYLLADSSGNAVLVEFYQGEMFLQPNEAAWHMATNHFRCIAEGDGGCPRYRRLSERLAGVNGQLEVESAMQLLADVKQGMTQWSVVYDLTSGEVNVALGGDYENIFSFEVDLARP